MSDPATTLDRLIARAGRLYSLPAVAMKVLELTNNPKVDTRALKECIENDPALTSKILGVVNSSLFGLSREVSDLNQALAMLGSKPLKLLVLGFSLPAGLFSGVGEEILGRYWRHTLTKAVAGREISQTLWNSPGDDAFIAGLLQDLGMLLLIQELEQPYVKFLDKAHASAKDLAELEIESMGFDHTQLSARLLAQWGLPESLVEAVVCNASRPQSDGPGSSPRDLHQILHLAELLARLLADQRSGVLSELLEAGRRYRDLSEAQLESLVDNLEEKIEQLADVLSLQLPQGLDYRDVLAEAHSQLARVATEAAADILRNDQAGGLKSEEEESLLVELRDLAAAAANVAGRPSQMPGSLQSPQVQQETPPASPRPAQRRSEALSATVAADPGLLGQLGVAVAACRKSRCPLSLLLFQLDSFEQLVAGLGVQAFGITRQTLEDLCRDVDHPCATCLPYGEAGFALILPYCERRLAVELGSQLIEQFRRWGPACLPSAGQLRAPPNGRGGQRAASISIGAATVALPPKNFPPDDLLAAAERCLYGSRNSGGDVVKSIEIY